MTQKKLVSAELNPVFAGNSLVNTVKTTHIDMMKSEKTGDLECVLKTDYNKFDTDDAAQQFAREKQAQASENLSVVANPYLIYSVHTENNKLMLFRSVYMKYGIVASIMEYTDKVPIIVPKKSTTIRYGADCTGLCNAEWISNGCVPNVQFEFRSNGVRSPKGVWRDNCKYAFIDCAVFFEEPEFAQAFRDEMLMQQALRRYISYGKIQKGWD